MDQLADLVDATRLSVRNWEKGRRRPYRKNLERVADRMDMTHAELEGRMAWWRNMKPTELNAEDWLGGVVPRNEGETRTAWASRTLRGSKGSVR